MTDIRRFRLVPVILMALALAGFGRLASAAEPQRVSFKSGDGRTMLTGYLFKPAALQGRVPAVVLLHGRAGPYSSLADGVYTAATLSKRHRSWGFFWAEQGYVALLVDSFGPRGYPAGFAAGTNAERPTAVDEVTVRPLDAYGALRYLRGRGDVLPDRVGLQGWSNGGSAALAAMGGVGIFHPTPASGFRAALAFYPGCGLHNHFPDGYRPYAPVRVFIGTDDEEVSLERCENLVAAARAAGGPIELKRYRGATHDFDDPGRKRQGLEENVSANEDAHERARRFFAEQLRAPPR
jgi:dienelactone hydrolase